MKENNSVISKSQDSLLKKRKHGTLKPTFGNRSKKPVSDDKLFVVPNKYATLEKELSESKNFNPFLIALRARDRLSQGVTMGIDGKLNFPEPSAEDLNAENPKVEPVGSYALPLELVLKMKQQILSKK